MSGTKVEEIANLSMSDLHNWVESSINNSDISTNFNWLGLTEVLSQKLREYEKKPEKIELAELLVRIYIWLAENDSYEMLRLSNISIIAIIIYMLSNKFVSPNHQQLGENTLWEFFKKGITISPTAAKEIGEKFRSDVPHPSSQLSAQRLNELKELRWIKNKLNLMRNLPSDNKLRKRQEFKNWLGLYKYLP